MMRWFSRKASGDPDWVVALALPPVLEAAAVYQFCCEQFQISFFVPRTHLVLWQRSDAYYLLSTCTLIIRSFATFVECAIVKPHAPWA